MVTAVMHVDILWRLVKLGYHLVGHWVHLLIIHYHLRSTRSELKFVPIQIHLLINLLPFIIFFEPSNLYTTRITINQNNNLASKQYPVFVQGGKPTDDMISEMEAAADSAEQDAKLFLEFAANHNIKWCLVWPYVRRHICECWNAFSSVGWSAYLGYGQRPKGFSIPQNLEGSIPHINQQTYLYRISNNVHQYLKKTHGLCCVEWASPMEVGFSRVVVTTCMSCSGFLELPARSTQNITKPIFVRRYKREKI